MALNNLKRILGGDTDIEEATVEDDFYSSSRESYREENGIAVSKMMLLEPRAYSESQQIADYLKARHAVVVNLKRVTPDQAKRIVDFLSGTIYAIGGDLEKLGGGIFLCTPNNVNVEGKITEERDTEQNKKQVKNDEDDDFNW